MTYTSRPTRFIVAPAGEPIFSSFATTIEIDDEAGGEFVRVRQLPEENLPQVIDHCRVGSSEKKSGGTMKYHARSLPRRQLRNSVFGVRHAHH